MPGLDSAISPKSHSAWAHAAWRHVVGSQGVFFFSLGSSPPYSSYDTLQPSGAAMEGYAAWVRRHAGLLSLFETGEPSSAGVRPTIGLDVQYVKKDRARPAGPPFAQVSRASPGCCRSASPKGKSALRRSTPRWGCCRASTTASSVHRQGRPPRLVSTSPWRSPRSSKFRCGLL